MAFTTARDAGRSARPGQICTVLVDREELRSRAGQTSLRLAVKIREEAQRAVRPIWVMLRRRAKARFRRRVQIWFRLRAQAKPWERLAARRRKMSP